VGAPGEGFLFPNWSVGVDCRMCLSVLVIGCQLSSAHYRFLGVAVGGRCWFLVVGCRYRWSLLVSICRVSLLVVDAGSRLSGVAVDLRVVAGSLLSGVTVGGCCWFLVVGCHCQWPLPVPCCLVLLYLVVAGSLLSGVSVGRRCWFRVVGCRCRSSFSGFWLSGVAVGGRWWFLVVGCRFSLSFSIVDAQLCLYRGSK
jgi:hypothetical protein